MPIPWRTPATALVLAAGNVASLGPRDVLSKLFVEGKVVVMKANPVNDYLVPHRGAALGSLVAGGVLRIVDGDATVGQVPHQAPAGSTKCTSPVRTRRTTPSGCSASGPEGERRKAADEPRLWTSR